MSDHFFVAWLCEHGEVVRHALLYTRERGWHVLIGALTIDNVLIMYMLVYVLVH